MHTGARCGKVHMDLNSDISEYTVARCGDINSGVSKSSHWPNQWSAWGGGRVLNMYIHPSLQHFADTTLHIIFRWSSLHDVTLHHTVVGWAPPTYCDWGEPDLQYSNANTDLWWDDVFNCGWDIGLKDVSLGQLLVPVSRQPHFGQRTLLGQYISTIEHPVTSTICAFVHKLLIPSWCAFIGM